MKMKCFFFLIWYVNLINSVLQLSLLSSANYINLDESKGLWWSAEDKVSVLKDNSELLKSGNLKNGERGDKLVVSEFSNVESETMSRIERSPFGLGEKQSLNLVHFTNKSITCNDGTPAGYYIRKSPYRSNNVWIIFLEGGWYCFNDRSCQNRWVRLRNLMSSITWPSSRHVGGILSSDPQENPYWSNANHIFVPYCSSDSWSGTVSKPAGNGFSFMGALIVDEVIKSLISIEGLRSTSTLVLAGSSAGGTGVMLNLDHVESLLRQEFGDDENPRVRGVADSGWFLDNVPSFVENGDCNDVILCPPEISLRKGMSLWNSRLPENCQNEYPEEPWSCFFGYKLYPTLKGSLFVFQWLFDEAQMLVSNLPTPAFRKEEWDYAYKLGDELKKSLVNVTSLMIPSCISHTVLTHRDWKQVEVNSVYLPRALKCWESGGIIEESNSITSSDSSQHYWTEATSLEENEAERIESDNSVKRRRHNHNGFDVTSSAMRFTQDLFPEVIDSNDSSRRNRRRHNRGRNHNNNNNKHKKRRRRRRQRKKFQQWRKLNQTIPVLPYSSQLSYQQKPRALHGEKSNMNNNRKNTHHYHQLSSNNGESLNNEQRRKQSRRTNPSHQVSNFNTNDSNNRNNFRSSNNNRNHSSRDDRSKNRLRRRRQRRWFSLCDGGGLKGEGGSPGGFPAGDMRLIEKCSWPQCNKSCPKLLNPLTGEEVDFKDLLKSFGLDMTTMAKALGIDLPTLNSMDHQVLLQMLTQHA